MKVRIAYTIDVPAAAVVEYRLFRCEDEGDVDGYLEHNDREHMKRCARAVFVLWLERMVDAHVERLEREGLTREAAEVRG